MERGVAGRSTADHQTTTGAVAAKATAAPGMTVKEAGETYLKLTAASNAAHEAWMSAAAPTAKTLAIHKQLAAHAAAYRRVAAAGTVAAYLTAAGQVPVTTSLTSDVRRALGLPESASE
ncbi:hypothetical protein [Paractinoplanes toevensis]|uniref:Uncharacterized protein n=1 Tax=Paractinoplanes toevensis TaxID=571911 RepID=A0A919T8E7_9ACTN|nr:hypothetical protein [Actinoplanes toevensis]GIM90763.1 hypothetical protein Ato02nite_025560 [Actinoplanes toevensis]